MFLEGIKICSSYARCVFLCISVCLTLKTMNLHAGTSIGGHSLLSFIGDWESLVCGETSKWKKGSGKKALTASWRESFLLPVFQQKTSHRVKRTFFHPEHIFLTKVPKGKMGNKEAGKQTQSPFSACSFSPAHVFVVIPFEFVVLQRQYISPQWQLLEVLDLAQLGIFSPSGANDYRLAILCVA